jgi:hypothetical protein
LQSATATCRTLASDFKFFTSTEKTLHSAGS